MKQTDPSGDRAVAFRDGGVGIGVRVSFELLPDTRLERRRGDDRSAHEKDAQTRLPDKISLEVKLPAGFPEKHRQGLIRAAETCQVKKTPAAPPGFDIRTLPAAERPADEASV